ncbi:hypothetical protein [Dokdonia sp. Asnod1-B02]|uniref:hypothetical protein n=1 Tax=Dokdonia sp. Asnod1-B02 TaxID=3160573 RepID=UPI00386308D6
MKPKKDFKVCENSLEYKLLSFLINYDDGTYLNMSNFIEDKNLLKIKLQNLAKEGLIYFDGGSHMFFGDGDDFVRVACLAKIKAEGKRYLQTLNQTNSVSNHYYNNVKQINQVSELSISQNNSNTKQDDKSTLEKILHFLSSKEFIILILGVFMDEIIKILFAII